MLKLFAKLTLQRKIKKDIAYMQQLADHDEWQLKLSTNQQNVATLRAEHRKKMSVINSLIQYNELIKKQ